jgi:hypothetical protein
VSTRPVPLAELATLVQNAVQQTLAKHGAVPIDQLWFGFVAPEQFGNQESAAQVANQIGHATGVKVTAVVATEGIAAGGVKAEAVRPGHIIGLVFNPKLAK